MLAKVLASKAFGLVLCGITPDYELVDLGERGYFMRESHENT